MNYKQYYKKHKKRYALNSRKSRYKRKYGMTIEQFDAMVVTQKSCCAICGTDKPNTNGKKTWCVDHDHKTNRVRGLLCNDCNLLIGYADDDVRVLKSAIRYLTQNTKV